MKKPIVAGGTKSTFRGRLIRLLIAAKGQNRRELMKSKFTVNITRRSQNVREDIPEHT